jgi:hypothetical protein
MIERNSISQRLKIDKKKKSKFNDEWLKNPKFKGKTTEDFEYNPTYYLINK